MNTDQKARRLTLGISIFAAIFVTGTAIFTGNPGLWALAGLSIAGAMGLFATGSKAGSVPRDGDNQT